MLSRTLVSALSARTMSVRLELLCPVDPAHGRLLDWPSERHGFMCPHAAHGGNGRFFSTDEAEGRIPTSRRERDITAADRFGEPDRALLEAPYPPPSARGVSPASGVTRAPTPGNQRVATQPRPASALASDAGGDHQLLGTASG